MQPRKPRKIRAPIFNKKMIVTSILQGIIALAVCLLAFGLGLGYGFSAEKARAFTFATLIATNITLILTNRSWSQSLFSKIREQFNLTLTMVISLTLGFAIIALYLEFAMRLFKFDHLSMWQVLIAILLGSIAAFWFEIFKKFRFYKTSN